MVSNYLNEQEQEQILCTLVTDFVAESFKSHLKKGLILTPKVVYLAYCRGDKSYLQMCFAATNVTEKAALLLDELYANSDAFWAMCMVGGKCYDVAPNYLLAFYAKRDKTLAYMAEKNLWNEVMHGIVSKIISRDRVSANEVTDWLKKNAPVEWLQKSGLI